MSVNETNIERFLLHEMRASGIVEWEGDDTFIWHGESQNYAVEVRVFPLGTTKRLKESE